MNSIGIVGAGIAGVHLALLLQREGMDVTLYAALTPEAQRQGRLPNNVARFGPTQRREAELGVAFWPADDYAMHCAHVRVRDPKHGTIAFRGDLAEPATFVDFRLYLPRLVEAFAERGGNVVAGEVRVALLEEIAARHDAVVVSSGRSELAALFERIAERSPFDVPQRRIVAGYFHGVRQPAPIGLHFEVVPGCGEIFQTPVLTFSGRVTGLTIEAIPGGPWDHALPSDDFGGDPTRVLAPLATLLREYSPEIHARIDSARFALVRPLDLLQGALVPVVRRAWARLPSGALVLAVGDALALNDPLTGQGGNLASSCAFELGKLLLSAECVDETFAMQWSQHAARLTESVTAWTNSFLSRPEAHVQQLMERAQFLKPLADAFVENFADPDEMWRTISTAQASAAFIDRCTTQAVAPGELPALHRRFVDALLRDDRAAIAALCAHESLHSGAGISPPACDGHAGVRTWLSDAGAERSDCVSIGELHIVERARHLAVISHELATTTQPGSPRRAFFSAVWVRGPVGWKAAFHQLSPAPLKVPV